MAGATTTTTTPTTTNTEWSFARKAKVAFYDAKGYDRKSFNHQLRCMGLENEIEFLFLEPRLTLQTVAFATGCDAVCAFVNDNLSAEVLAALSDEGIQLICMRCAGFDVVDVAAAGKLDISVTRVPAYSPQAVAEFAVALLLTLNRKTHRAFNRVRDANFTLSGLVGFDLYGKTVGVIGTGKIGQCFIDIMLGFGCKVLCYDLFPCDAVKQKKGATYVSLDELLSESHVISLHAPLTPQTTHIINRTTINKMRPGVTLINTSRGGLVDSRALLEGLISGRVGGAGLDVYEREADYFFRDVSEEEMDDDILARFINMRNVVLTSHQAFLTEEALVAIATTTLTNLKEFFVDNKRFSQLTNYVAPPPSTPVAVQRALTRRASKGDALLLHHPGGADPRHHQPSSHADPHPSAGVISCQGEEADDTGKRGTALHAAAAGSEQDAKKDAK